MQHYIGWETFHAQPIAAKLPLFQNETGELRDVIYAQQFTRPTLEALFSLADRIRSIAKTQNGALFLRTLLADKCAMLFFVQPSTRTFLSFQNACQMLGMQVSEIRDASTSSEVKGESPEDMIRTFSSYVDMIIVRHFDEGFAERAAWTLNTHAYRAIPVINGGSGKDQHPTQALLDMYTLQRAFAERGGIDGKTIAMVGDLSRGRTVRSLCHLLSLYQDIQFYFISPKEFAMRPDILAFLDSRQIKYTVTENFKGTIPKVDAIYATRIQDEHDKNGESRQVDYAGFCFMEADLALLQPHAVILHPFPRRDEIDVRVDKDPRALYWKQARNGMWARAALILTLFGRDKLV